MQTNSLCQQNTRRMAPAQKAAMIAADIAADHAVNEAHAAKFRATQALWQAAYAAGYSPAERHGLDMLLMGGADPVVLLAAIDPRSPAERYMDDFATETLDTLNCARPS
jgi:hypothetical protein